jgi:hypothetical protein
MRKNNTMKFSPLLKISARITAPVLLALLLAIALMPAAAFANHPGHIPNQPVNNGGGGNAPTETIPDQPEEDQNENQNENQDQNQDPGLNIPDLPVEEEEKAPTGVTPTPHPSAPFSPPADCIVAHAATPAQLCPVSGGLQYYFIGADGSSQPGPWIQPLSELATLHSTGFASLYSGTNPKTGKSVQIHFLGSENKIRVSTFYPDTQYDTNKPYNFTVDSNNSVSHEAW